MTITAESLKGCKGELALHMRGQNSATFCYRCKEHPRFQWSKTWRGCEYSVTLLVDTHVCKDLAEVAERLNQEPSE